MTLATLPHADLPVGACGTIVALHRGMFKMLSATASMSCPLCGRSVAPTADSTWVIAWYTCPRCGQEWSARIRNGKPDLPAETVAPVRRNNAGV